jgi:acid phosphatase class B
MKKIVMLLAAVAIAASPAMAEAKKKKMTKEEKEAADIAQQHDNTRRAVRDALPLVLPSWSLPIFFGTHMDDKLHKM